jgi:hypothetical protein
VDCWHTPHFFIFPTNKIIVVSLCGCRGHKPLLIVQFSALNSPNTPHNAWVVSLAVCGLTPSYIKYPMLSSTGAELTKNEPIISLIFHHQLFRHKISAH